MIVAMKAAIYTRVSTHEPAPEGLSLSTQEDRCRQAAVAARVTSVAVYRDKEYAPQRPRRD